MTKLVKKLKNGKSVVFDQGRFDNWCVYVVSSNDSRFAPLDNQYFSELLEISKKYSKNKVYNDFVKIYDKTTAAIDKEVIELIEKISYTYNIEDQPIVEKWFTVIYAGMIAEENKERTILKKRIKRLGMHQVLIDNLAPNIAANFSKGKKWRELDAIMKKKGF